LDFAYAYIDNPIIAISSPEEHLENFRSVFQRLDEQGIGINVSMSNNRLTLCFVRGSVNTAADAWSCQKANALHTCNH